MPVKRWPTKRSSSDTSSHANNRSICASVLAPSPNNTAFIVASSNAQPRARSSGDRPRSAMTARKLVANVIAVLMTGPPQGWPSAMPSADSNTDLGVAMPAYRAPHYHGDGQKPPTSMGTLANTKRQDHCRKLIENTSKTSCLMHVTSCYTPNLPNIRENSSPKIGHFWPQRP